MASFFLLCIGLFSASCIAQFIGTKKRIGFGWSFFFSFFLSPLIGLVFSIISPRLNNLKPATEGLKAVSVVVGSLCGIFSVMILFNLIATPAYERELRGVQGSTLYNLWMATGFGGLSIYLFNRFKRSQMVYELYNIEEAVKQTEDEISSL
jgi:hypothetical protein